LESKLLNTFAAIEEAQALEALQALNDYVGDCRQWAFAARVIWIFERIGIVVDHAKLERTWAKNCPLPEKRFAGIHSHGLTDPEAIAELEVRLAVDRPSVRFEEHLLHLGSGNLESRVFESPPWTNSEWLREKLRASDSHRIVPILQEVWKRCEHPALREELGQFREALDNALSALASENDISPGRVQFIKTGEWPPNAKGSI